MADNYPITDANDTEQTIGAKEVAGVKYTRTVPQVADADVSTANPMPISDAGGSITVDGTVAVTGVATAANQASELTLIGAVTETAPASDTASSGLNGRLQRIAQRITSLIALLPSSIGQKNGAGSVSVVLASDQGQVPVTASQQTDTMYSGTTALTPKFAAISAASSGNNTIVAAVTGKKIRVLTYTVIATSAVTVQWRSSTAGTNLTGAMPYGANGGATPPFCPVGHFETASGELLNMVLGGAVQVSGHVTYVEV